MTSHSDKPFIGTKEQLVNAAWPIWLENQILPLEEMVKQLARSQMTEFEAAWKIGYLAALVAYERGAFKRVDRG